ncbi:unnamed protein product [Mortierella alpina]
MESVDEAAFSFRRKKSFKSSMNPTTLTNRLSPAAPPTDLCSPPASHQSVRSPTPLSANVSAPTLDNVIASTQPSSLQALGSTTAHAPTVSTAPPSSCEEAAWELVWKGSWIVPTLVPASSSSSSSSRKSHASLKRVSLESRQTAFEGKDGRKIQPQVVELTGIVFAVPRSTLSNAFQEEEHGQEAMLAHSAMGQSLHDGTEMHLIAKIALSTFPTFLLSTACTQPCRVFTALESQESARFLRGLLDKDDIADMRKRCRQGHRRAAGDVGLLLRVTSKPGPTTKKRGVIPSLAKQDHNPFLIPSVAGAAPLSASIAPTSASHLPKVYQEASMFLVYGVLDGDQAGTRDDTSHIKSSHKSSSSESSHPTISFLAHPLMELSDFLEETLLNSRSMEQLQRDLENDNGANLSPHMETVDHVHYEDAIVDSIMNGCGEEYESGYGSEKATAPDVDIDEDGSLRQELEFLTALERSKAWSPYTVLPPPNTESSCSSGSLRSKDGSKERTLARTQTLNRMAFSSKDGPTRSVNSWTRHRSMGDPVREDFKPVAVSSNNPAKVAKKGLGRLKSPSRAPQQPLDVTTESLRRKLLGPGSIRKPLSSKLDGSSFSSMHVGLKSPSRRKSAGGSFSSRNDLTGNDDIPDLMTMMRMKRRQNEQRSQTLAQDEGSPFMNPLATTSSSRSTATLTRSVTESSLGSSHPSSNPFLDTLKSLQDEPESEQEDNSGTASGSIVEASSPFISSSHSKARPPALPSGLASLNASSSSSSSKSIEAQNKATIKGLIKSVLRKINIGTDHEDFEACAGVLYEGVKVAMRRDITTKRYHLEELERLMDRHAALL